MRTRIPIRFALFHAGSKLSYLRYMTFATLRHHHPEAEITLFTTTKYNRTAHNWNVEKQDFEVDIQGMDFKNKLHKLNVEIVVLENFFPDENPVFQSDFFRWWWLSTFGGFYLDTDQIILKPFSTLPLDKEFIYSEYCTNSCGRYYPVGVIGSAQGGLVATVAHQVVTRCRDNNDYNSTGPWMLKKIAKHLKLTKHNSFDAPYNYFYPIAESSQMESVYKGHYRTSEAFKYILKDAYSFHWFGGMARSQEFNRMLTPYNIDLKQNMVCDLIKGNK